MLAITVESVRKKGEMYILHALPYSLIDPYPVPRHHHIYPLHGVGDGILGDIMRST